MATSAVQRGEIVPASDKEETILGGEGDGKCKEKTKSTTEWVIQVEQRFKNKIYKTRESSRDVCIFKVPLSIRYWKPQAYDSDVVPLGPFFHNEDKKGLPATADYKLSAVEATLCRLKVPKIESLIDSVMLCMDEIRNCYQDRAIECNEKTLAWMMIMDACFIIEFIYYYDGNEVQVFKLIFERHHQRDILVDILKLENQIPMRVLKLILELHREETALSKFAENLSRWWEFRGYPFSEELQSGNDNAKKVEQYIRDGDASHLLDLHRMVITDILLGSASASAQRAGPCFSTVCSKVAGRLFRVFRFSNSADNNENHNDFPSATMLRRAGIELHQSLNGKIRFEKQVFGSATLFLPQIVIEDLTEKWLRNLMALEECLRCVRPDGTRIITYYTCLLNSLIDSKEDVMLLRKGNIFKNMVGSDEEIAEMFNNIDNGITKVFYDEYDEVLKSVGEHYNKKYHHWIAGVKERYFSEPWLVASLGAAILILVMTAVQTTYTLKQYYGHHE